MQWQQEEGAARASEDSSSGRGKTKTSTTGGEFALLKLDMKKVDVATVDKVVEKSTLCGALWHLHTRVHGASMAAAANRLDLVAYFIEQRKVPVNTVTEEERCIYPDLLVTPLCTAIIKGRREIMNYLLDRMDKREVDTRVSNKGTCLMLAAQMGEHQVVKRLVLEFGADIDLLDAAGHNAIFNAVRKGLVRMVDFFLEHARSQGWKSDGRHCSRIVVPARPTAT